MTRSARRLLAISAAVGKVGFVYLVDGELMDWGLSRKASKSVDNVFATATNWLIKYRPDLVVIEKVNGSGRKGVHTKSLTEALKAAALDRSVRVEALARPMTYPSKYHEARDLAVEFPQIEPWLPNHRRLYDTEPDNIILFEALSLAVAWLAQNGAEDDETD